MALLPVVRSVRSPRGAVLRGPAVEVACLSVSGGGSGSSGPGAALAAPALGGGGGGNEPPQALALADEAVAEDIQTSAKDEEAEGDRGASTSASSLDQPNLGWLDEAVAAGDAAGGGRRDSVRPSPTLRTARLSSPALASVGAGADALFVAFESFLCDEPEEEGATPPSSSLAPRRAPAAAAAATEDGVAVAAVACDAAAAAQSVAAAAVAAQVHLAAPPPSSARSAEHVGVGRADLRVILQPRLAQVLSEPGGRDLSTGGGEGGNAASTRRPSLSSRGGGSMRLLWPPLGGPRRPSSGDSRLAEADASRQSVDAAAAGPVDPRSAFEEGLLRLLLDTPRSVDGADTTLPPAPERSGRSPTTVLRKVASLSLERVAAADSSPPPAILASPCDSAVAASPSPATRVVAWAAPPAIPSSRDGSLSSLPGCEQAAFPSPCPSLAPCAGLVLTPRGSSTTRAVAVGLAQPPAGRRRAGDWSEGGEDDHEAADAAAPATRLPGRISDAGRSLWRPADTAGRAWVPALDAAAAAAAEPSLRLSRVRQWLAAAAVDSGNPGGGPLPPTPVFISSFPRYAEGPPPAWAAAARGPLARRRPPGGGGSAVPWIEQLRDERTPGKVAADEEATARADPIGEWWAQQKRQLVPVQPVPSGVTPSSPRFMRPTQSQLRLLLPLPQEQSQPLPLHWTQSGPVLAPPQSTLPSTRTSRFRRAQPLDWRDSLRADGSDNRRRASPV